MTVLFVVFVVLMLIMYLEGLAMAGAVIATLKPSKFISLVLFLFWPIALPVAAYMLYRKFKPLLEAIKPMAGMLLSQDIGGNGLIGGNDSTYEK